MNPQEDYKRKYSGLIHLKNNPTHVGAKDRRKTDISREKEQKKNIYPPERGHSKMYLHGQDENAKFNHAKGLNFKSLKDTLPKDRAQGKKNTQHQNNPSEYFQKALKPSHSPNQGLSINVNIQHILQSRAPHGKNSEGYDTQAMIPKSDRSHIEEEKGNKKTKKALITYNKKYDDSLECTEEIIVKKTEIQVKTKPQEKTVEKTALIDRKSYRKDPHVKPKQKSTSQANPQNQFKDAMKKFQSEAETINSTVEFQTFAYLDYKQSQYNIPPDYIEKCQKNLSWNMRSKLFEWAMHVSYEFSMKRQTFYLAANIMDLFMTREHHLLKNEFQLLGAAAMFIASKLEEFDPKSSEKFAKATIIYNDVQIKQMERRIVRILKYNLNPPTLYMWANRLMLQWDNFIESNNNTQRNPFFASYDPRYFKKNNDSSYQAFRMMMQLVDCSFLDIQTLQYKTKLLVCAFMYLVMGKQMGVFKSKEIVQVFPRSSQYLLDEENLYNCLFLDFLHESFGLTLIDLLPAVQYTATYFILPMTFQDPILPEQECNQLNFQDFCSYQTHNPNLLGVIKKRFRGIYQ